MNSKLSDIKESICSHIDTWLSQHKEYTNQTFAKKLGVTDTSVMRWRKRVCIPNVDIFPDICNILGITLSAFLGYNDMTVLSQKEKELLTLYRESDNFKSIIDKYLSYQEFQNNLNSILK
mgnify:CR=1 FL=1